MAFQYYQAAPGWGQQQYQFGSPPPLGYQPDYNWNGLDYYRAHVSSRGGQYDPAFYQNVVSRAGQGAVVGSGYHEAKHWHRRAYGGIAELTRLLPNEVGAAAAYEAWRQYRHTLSHYDYLDPYDRRLEAMRGLAVAEAVRLWQDTGRGFDQYNSQMAAEAAAATVDHILRRKMGGGGSHNVLHRGENPADAYYRGRRNSVSGFGGTAEAYTRARTRSRSPMPMPGGVPSYAGSGYAGSGYGSGGSAYGGGGSVYGGGGSVVGTPMTAAMPISSSPYGYASTAPMVSGSPISGMPMQMQTGYSQPGNVGGFAPSATAQYAAAYGGGTQGVYDAGAQMGYPAGYAGSAYGQQPQVIMTSGSGSGHRRRRRHSHVGASRHHSRDSRSYY
ncbi:hypothetical protein PENSPDRAFT_753413 [Peniophora sp. CONT]|nr:hypothetical protein PENSPDRAFT_753413 [Peniophora sp. CONT]